MENIKIGEAIELTIDVNGTDLTTFAALKPVSRVGFSSQMQHPWKGARRVAKFDAGYRLT